MGVAPLIGLAPLMGEELGCVTSISTDPAFVLVDAGPLMGDALGCRAWLRIDRTPSLCPRAGVGPVANAIARDAPRAPVVVRAAPFGDIFLVAPPRASDPATRSMLNLLAASTSLSLTCAWPDVNTVGFLNVVPDCSVGGMASFKLTSLSCCL